MYSVTYQLYIKEHPAMFIDPNCKIIDSKKYTEVHILWSLYKRCQMFIGAPLLMTIQHSWKNLWHVLLGWINIGGELFTLSYAISSYSPMVHINGSIDIHTLKENDKRLTIEYLNEIKQGLMRLNLIRNAKILSIYQ